LKNIIPTRDGKEILDDFGAFESTEMVRWLCTSQGPHDATYPITAMSTDVNGL
jgi:hypothetical protein